MDKMKALENASRFMNSIDEKMNGIVIEGTFRARLFNGFLHLSLEHFGSIIQLVGSGMVGSAAALIRPQYEALIRGLYFQECASESRVESFVNGEDPITLYKMVESLDEAFSIDNNPLSSIYAVLKNRMHAFTHGGFEQISKRYSEDALVNSFSDEDSIQLIKLAHILAVYSATLACAVAGREDLAREFVRELGSL